MTTFLFSHGTENRKKGGRNSGRSRGLGSMVGPFCLFARNAILFWGESVHFQFSSVRCGYWGNSSNDFMRRAADEHPIIPGLSLPWSACAFQAAMAFLVAFHTSATGHGAHG